MNIANNTVLSYWTPIGGQVKIGRHNMIYCICKCGKEKYVRASRLQDGTSKSCGCRIAEMRTTHGKTKTSIRKQSHEYWIWNAMIQRTTNQKNSGYKNYGGRGIGVCDSWRTFETFFLDMGNRPTKKHSLERVDNNLGYCKENCKWATRLEQNHNKRNTRLLTANGITKCLTEWARDIGVSHGAIIYRLSNGWSIEMAVTTPPQRST